ncbi:HAD family hydrolase [Halovulum dunhuangense]|uniref:phosphoglycolate phosphatase n=1 Tax=Halovulum dunhuangense TaxID=1505036 RepID=A0A849L5G4_9RHOB|nr:HAD family hydrolase [Halovulum dunhuangense]
MASIQAIIFDKDGTLFDFKATWGAWTGRFIRDIAGPHDRVEQLAAAVRFDLEADQHLPDSPFIAGTVDDWVELVIEVLPELGPDELRAIVRETTGTAVQVPVAPLDPLMAGLRQRGLRLGVATNDGIGPVTHHLHEAGIAHHFDFVAGYDSGHGAKPGPGMLLAFAEATGIDPAATVMVGDSRHDLEAGRAAGMRRLAVLTGHATAPELSPHAEAVLPSIAALPGWLDGLGA